MNIYGQILTGRDVRIAVENTLRLWMPVYLAEVGRQAGRDSDALEQIRSWTNTAKGIQRWAGQQFPSCVIVVGAMTDIEQHGDGQHSGVFPVGVGFICTSKDQESVNELVQLYTGAGAAAIVQHKSLGGFASGTEWIDTSYDEIDTDLSRTMAGGAVNLRVAVDSVLDSRAGPAVAPFDPLADPPTEKTTQTAGVTVGATTDLDA